MKAEKFASEGAQAIWSGNIFTRRKDGIRAQNHRFWNKFAAAAESKLLEPADAVDNAQLNANLLTCQ